MLAFRTSATVRDTLTKEQKTQTRGAAEVATERPQQADKARNGDGTEPLPDKGAAVNPLYLFEKRLSSALSAELLPLKSQFEPQLNRSCGAAPHFGV